MILSLAMILRPDASFEISRCLKSCYDIFDEIIIVTNKNDNTNINYNVKKFEFDWCDDFAVARNLSFEKCSGKYIMWLDSDDIITSENGTKLFCLKDTLEKSEIICYVCDYIYSPIETIPRRRIIKKENAEWIYPIHEVLKPVDFVKTNIEILHRPDILRKYEHSQRNLRLLEKAWNGEYHEDERIRKLLHREYLLYGQQNKILEKLNLFSI